jgi:hypothetical protein
MPLKEKHSQNFLHAKKYYFQDRLKIKEVKIKIEKKENKDSVKSKIVFDNVGEDLILEGDEQDFIEISFKLKSTIRDGKKEIIDISTTPAYDGNTYYENVDLFVTKGKTDIKETVSNLEKGIRNISPTTDLKDGIISILKNNYSNTNAKEILNNYFEAIALLILRLKPIHSGYETIKKRLVKNESRFNTYISNVDRIFKTALKMESTIKPILILDKKCKADIDFLLQKLADTIKSIDGRWRTLYPLTGGVMEGEEAIKFICGDYEKLFELVADPLKDFVLLLKTEDEEISLTSEEQIISFLKRKGFSALVSTIDNDLRNASAHNSIDYSEKGIVKLYDSRLKNRTLIKEIKYKNILEKYEKLNDLVIAITFGYILNLEVIYLRALDSPEFKFFVIENKPKS